MYVTDGTVVRTAKVLLISSDAEWATQTAVLYRTEGLDVEHCWQGSRALDAVRESTPDVVVLDLTIPDRYGPTVCASLRARTSMRIVAVGTSHDEHRVLSALGSGADAYAVKGKRPRELVARTRALLRRVPPSERRLVNHLRVGDVEVEPGCRASLRGHDLQLGDAELAIFELLVDRVGTVVRRDELLLACSADMRDPAALDVHVRRLRSKLEAIDPVRRIEAVRSVGFRLLRRDSSPSEPFIDLADEPIDLADHHHDAERTGEADLANAV